MTIRIGVALAALLVLLVACGDTTAVPTAGEVADGSALRPAAHAADLFFSEYVEGSSNNKALEIYNGGAAAIDLAACAYDVQMFFNGSTSAGLTIGLTGTVAAGDVYVLAHASATSAVLAVADQTNGAGWFNGDDAVVLRKGTQVVDAVGQIGLDPGAEWGSGLVSTADNTLRRKAAVSAGDADPSDAFDPAAQWDGFATDTFDGLGTHDAGEHTGGGETETCGDVSGTTLISEVQGAEVESPLLGQTVTIEGVVVGDFQPGDGDPFGSDLAGYFVQEEDDDADGDPATSEGIFVFDRNNPVSVGDKVRITGRASEFFGMTQIDQLTAFTRLGVGLELPEATVITLPVDAVDDLEAFEGMLVTFPQSLLISEYFNFDRFGEVVLSAPIDGSRVYQPTSLIDPADASAIAAAADLIARSRITLDDGRSAQNPDPVRHPDGTAFDMSNLFRGGDLLTDVTGVLHFGSGRYRVQPTQGAIHSVQNPRPPAPADVGGSVRVASFNVLNYFDTLDLGPDICGPGQDQECRGADTPEELARQRAKIVAALSQIDAEVVGLVEIENDVDQGAIADLVDAMNLEAGATKYDYVDTAGPVGPDAIRVAIIYQPGAVQPLGDPAILGTAEFLDPNATGQPRNRAAIAQTFEAAGGGRFTFVVNHLKSKGSSCEVAGDDDPIQGACNVTRLEAVGLLLEWLATDPTGSADEDFLLVGDYNAYALEDPIAALLAGGYTDLLAEYSDDPAYTFVFDGQLGYLDHAFSSGSLTPQVTGATVWHINADEVDLIDYDMSFKSDAQDALFAPDPYRSSDHDPVVVGLDLTALDACGEVAPSMTRLWPANGRLVPVGLSAPGEDGLLFRIDSVFQDEPVEGEDDGRGSPDAIVKPDGRLELRAQRDGEGNGRVYHIAFTATDGADSCSGVVLVQVPVSQGRNGAAIDDGPLYDSTMP